MFAGCFRCDAGAYLVRDVRRMLPLYVCLVCLEDVVCVSVSKPLASPRSGCCYAVNLKRLCFAYVAVKPAVYQGQSLAQEREAVI